MHDFPFRVQRTLPSRGLLQLWQVASELKILLAAHLQNPFVGSRQALQGFVNWQLCLTRIFRNFQVFCGDTIMQTVQSKTRAHWEDVHFLGFFANFW